MTDPRWDALERMRPALVRELSDSGVIRVDYVAAFPSSDEASVWLVTQTDVERDALLDQRFVLLTLVRRVADGCGFPLHQVSGVDVQSEETVTRDFGGSWFHALR